MLPFCSEVMSKRMQKESGEERVTAKSRPMMSVILRAPSALSSSVSESPGDLWIGNNWLGKSFMEIYFFDW